MTISINNGVLTLQNDGPYSWDDVVAAAGANIDQIDGVYHVNIEINVIDCVLNIQSKNIVFSHPINTSDAGNGVINFGELVTDTNGNDYAVNGCSIVFNAQTTLMGGFYASSSFSTRLDSRVNYYGSHVSAEVTNSRITLGISTAVDTVFSRSSATGTLRFIAILQNAASVLRSDFIGAHSIIANDTLADFSDVQLIRCINGVRASTPDITHEFKNVSVRDSVATDLLISSAATNSGFRAINSLLDIKKSALFSPTQKRYRAVTMDIGFIDQLGPVEGALIELEGANPANGANTSFSNVTDANGTLPTMIVDIESAINDTPEITTDHSAYTITCNSYLHCDSVEHLTLQKQVGHGSNAPDITLLKRDPLITITEAEAQALTAINSAEDAYNAYKTFKRHSTETLPALTRVANQIISDAPIIIDPNAAALISYSGGILTFRSTRFVGGISAEVSLMNGAIIEGGDYGRVNLENGFNGNAVFTNVTIGELVNNTSEDMITNVLTTSTQPKPCMEAN